MPGPEAEVGGLVVVPLDVLEEAHVVKDDAVRRADSGVTAPWPAPAPRGGTYPSRRGGCRAGRVGREVGFVMLESVCSASGRLLFRLRKQMDFSQSVRLRHCRGFNFGTTGWAWNVTPTWPRHPCNQS